jgi:hypothetical protein
MVELEQRLPLADELLAALDRLPRRTAQLIATTLMLGHGGLSGLGGCFDAYLNGSQQLAQLQAAYQLRRLARDGEMLDRLGAVDVEPWASLRRALDELRELELQALTSD